MATANTRNRIPDWVIEKLVIRVAELVALKYAITMKVSDDKSYVTFYYPSPSGFVSQVCDHFDHGKEALAYLEGLLYGYKGGLKAGAREAAPDFSFLVVVTGKLHHLYRIDGQRIERLDISGLPAFSLTMALAIAAGIAGTARFQVRVEDHCTSVSENSDLEEKG